MAIVSPESRSTREVRSSACWEPETTSTCSGSQRSPRLARTWRAIAARRRGRPAAGA